MANTRNITGQRFGMLVVIRPTSERRRSSVVWECKCDCGNTAFVPAVSLRSGGTTSCGCAQTVDITGQRFGKLIAVCPTSERRGHSIVWECKCDCGNTAFVSAINLRRGDTASCGCAKYRRKGNDLAGQRFGQLVAIRPTDERKNGSVVWECNCDCGNTAFVSATNLRSGHTTSCGCVKSGKKASDLTGQHFGQLIAVRPTNERRRGSIVWECKCDCGNTAYVTVHNLQSGNTTSCGCVKPGKKASDLTGQRFGKLVAIHKTDERKGTSVVWKCKCDCGNTAFVSAFNLRKGYTTSCGCVKPGKKASDLTGQRFGMLVAIRPTDERKGTSVVWECKCDCGNTKLVPAASLRAGNTASCGCVQTVDITGQRFGKLVAIRPTDERIHGNVAWECKCDCGNTKLVPATSLRNGNTTSCGCVKAGPKSPDITGQRFGWLTAIREIDERKNGHIMWECKCDCGNTKIVRASTLLRGATISCGCAKSVKAEGTGEAADNN